MYQTTLFELLSDIYLNEFLKGSMTITKKLMVDLLKFVIEFETIVKSKKKKRIIIGNPTHYIYQLFSGIYNFKREFKDELSSFFV